MADGLPAVVPVRDSKDPQGSVLCFGVVSWVAFIGELKV
ncbi:DUF397 domain-containing protein [Streptomyces sp. ME02-8801-2C]|nr:DUF397 domain-containing protein [Streptomyces sp. ME02-8801-2C]MDX3456131.1 DUF397 domain-containing protein [Streptomyces sp. ME02-8801-2C]